MLEEIEEKDGNTFLTENLEVKSIIMTKTTKENNINDLKYKKIEKQLNSTKNQHIKPVIPLMTDTLGTVQFLERLKNNINNQTNNIIETTLQKQIQTETINDNNQTESNQGYQQQQPESFVAEGYVAQGDDVKFMLFGNTPPMLPMKSTPVDIRIPIEKEYRPSRPTVPVLLRPKHQHQRRVIPLKMTESLTTLSTNDNNEEESSNDESLNEEFIPETDKAVMLIETNRLMQLYFAKKFLQLDLVVDVQVTFSDAREALVDNPYIYGVIFISLNDLLLFSYSDIKQTLMNLIPSDLNKNKYSIVIYGAVNSDDEILEILEQCSVSDIMEEPYTLTNIKVNHIHLFILLYKFVSFNYL